MADMKKAQHFARGAAFGLSSLFVFVGVVAFAHDLLVIGHYIPPQGDGPFGVIAGPIFAIIGAVWFAWLRSTRSVLD